jgi:hypothetical protein
MKRIWIVIFLFWPLTASAAGPATPQQMTEAFFQSIEKGDIAGGYDRLFIGSSIPQDKPQAVTLIKQQTQSGLPLYGKIIGHELIKEEKFGTAIVRMVYVLKAEKGPTMWELYFYKPKDTWFLANILFNDQYGLLR